ncbi:MAG: hypothetical protein WDW36_007715 [Sanguina aurantia]
MGVFSDDSTGKGKIAEAKNRNRILASVFLLGLCLGVVISERAYISKATSVSTSFLKPVPSTAHTHSSTMLSCTTFSPGVTGANINSRARSLYATIAHSVHARAQTPEGAAAGGAAAAAPAAAAPAAFGASADGKPRNDLEELLLKIAPGKEVLVAVANKNTQWDGMLDTFMKGIRNTKVDNHLILALDVETKKWCDDNKVNSYLLSMAVAKAQADTGENHAVSAMKFGILRRFVSLGYSVLLSDVDVCIFRNPFDNLYRDSDVEGMSDGFDERTAYGSIEGFDDPSMGWGALRTRTLDLLTRLDDRLTKTKYWDQTAYNEEIFFLSHGAYKSPQVSVRIMELHRFMNSKFLFKDVRQRAPGARPEMPVIVHVNYHPDKHERMRGVIKFYLEGNEAALAAFPGGSEAGTR